MGCLRKLKAERVDVPVQEEKLGFNTVLYNNVNVPENNIVDTMRDKTREDITGGKLKKNRKEKPAKGFAQLVSTRLLRVNLSEQ